MNDSQNIIPYIIFQRDQLNASQQEIAEYIISNPMRAIENTSKEMAQALNISEASIVRFCQKIGFKGYRDFRLKLAQEQGPESNQAIPQGITREDNAFEVARKVMKIEYEDIKFTSEMLNEETFTTVLRLITECDKLAFFGVGSSSLVAATAKEHFLHYGKPALSESVGLTQLVLANTLEAGDVAFAFSISGASKETIKTIEIAAQRGAHTVCMTQNSASPLARISQHVLQVYKKDCSIDDLGTATRIAHLALTDALAVAYAAQRWDETERIAQENKANFREFLYSK